MKTFLLVVILSLFLCLNFFHVFALEPNTPRLIELKDGRKIWMNERQIEELASQSPVTTFMDITDTLNLQLGETPKVDPIPSKPRFQEIVKKLTANLNSQGLREVITKLSNFYTRYYTSETGKQAAEYLYNEVKSTIDSLPSSRRSLFQVRFFTHSWLQPSVIVTMKGKSSPNEFVIVGAHEDSTSSSGRAPGADDNASGSATVMSVFKAVANSDFVPDRTVEWQFYSAEEVGLRGSQAIAQEYKSKNIAVFAAMNFDMTGYNYQNLNTMGVVSDRAYTTEEVNVFIRKLIEEYAKYKWGNINCGYACTDHASWTRAGYRASSPFEATSMSNMNRNIHTPNDTIEKLDLERGVEFVKLGVAWVVECGLKA